MRAVLVAPLLLGVAGASFSLAYFWPGRTNPPSVAAPASASPPSGPTAEETVAFLAFGMEDGSTVAGLGRGPVQVKRENASPAVFTTTVDGKQLRISITTIEPCKYRLSAAVDGVENPARDILDFSNIKAIGLKLKKDGPAYLSADGKGFWCGANGCRDGGTPCTISQGIGCEVGSDFSRAYGFERMSKAYDYFKTSFCAAKAL